MKNKTKKCKCGGTITYIKPKDKKSIYKMKRQEYWKEQGYTEEQIENHLMYERRKAKDIRERKKRNNISNQETIKQIKSDLLGNTFYGNRGISSKVLSISPTIDGAGFWFKIHRTFSDKSNGEFRYFEGFNGYNKSEFIKNLNYL